MQGCSAESISAVECLSALLVPPLKVRALDNPKWMSKTTSIWGCLPAPDYRKVTLVGFALPLYGSANWMAKTCRMVRRKIAAIPNPDEEEGMDSIVTIYTESDAISEPIGNGLALEPPEPGHGREDQENKRALYLDKIRAERNFGAIVGESRALKTALQMVSIVAPTDSSVMILGETGTGKELIARAIHNLSTRRDRGFIKLNCAAIPLGLLESELFGHEKGAFTGAIAQKTGRFQLANKGTLFLDEVGDIPLELQAKLLRVLQEQEFERLGSNHTHKVDVRLIAATHRDLTSMVKQMTFREDLYYRLKVFPINLPSLRQRPEDIPGLTAHFAALYAQRLKKKINEIPTETMDALVRYHWHGNIRELEHFIQRAVILSPLAVLRAPISELEPIRGYKGFNMPMSGLEEIERDHILGALEASDWVVGGRNGAAARLGVQRTSLIYKMRKLRISRPAPTQLNAADKSRACWD
jgi:formate hydrogenlyase transcriptional activator